MRLAALTLLLVALASGGSFPDIPVIEALGQAQSLQIEPGDGTPESWWRGLEEVAKIGVDHVLNLALPLVMDIAKNADVSPDCVNSLMVFVSGLRRLKPWAFHMVDAFGKPVPGILTGTITFFGQHEQCLEVTAYKNDGNETFRGNYCTVQIQLPMPPKTGYVPSGKPLKELKNFTMDKTTILQEFSSRAQILYTIPVQLDVCVPSTCSKMDLENGMAYLLDNFGIEAKVTFCHTRQNYSWQTHQIVIICLFAMLFVLIAAGTTIDVVRSYSAENKSLLQRTETYGAKLLRAFSVVYNLRLIFHPETTHRRLACMHGVRLLSMGWIIFATSYFGFNHRILSQLEELEKIGQYFIFQFIFNSSVAVDSFFFLSGVMLTYITLGTVKKCQGKFNILSYMIKRLWRVTPTIVFFIGGYILLGDNKVGGPLWHETMAKDVENCKRNWWANLLYVSNLVLWPDEYCLYDSWYFSCDMQLHFIALVVIYLIHKWPRVGLGFNSFLIALSVFANGYLTYLHNFTPVLLLSVTDNDLKRDYDTYLYHQPWCHLGVYSIGVFAGYLLHIRPEIRLSRKQIVAGWTVNMLGMVALVHSTYLWNNTSKPLPTTADSIVYASLYRPLWGLGLCWVVLTCVYGQGGMINKFLSWRGFIPLGRLTFMVFLMQTFIRHLFNGILQERIPISHVTAIFVFFTILVNVYFMAFFFHLLIDAPVFTLRRLVLQKQRLERTISRFSANLSSAMAAGQDNQVERGEVNGHPRYSIS